MEEPTQQTLDTDIEDGELTESDDGYTPLQRPTTENSNMCSHKSNCISVIPIAKMADDTQSDFGQSTDSSSADSDSCLKKLSNNGAKASKKKSKRTIMVRTKTSALDNRKRAFKKYDIWTSSLQEDDLTENMRGIDVAKYPKYDRNVESYDYTQKYRLLGENCLKRRMSTSTDDFSDTEFHQKPKRGRPGESVKNRLGQRLDCPLSAFEYSNEPRSILDLEETEGRESHEIAREIANKLYEDKDELMIRIVEVVGTDLPIEVYKETQRIEANGGMMVKDGTRRRTPGGVFLFLLKGHERITTEEQKLIFFDEKRNSAKWKKDAKAVLRHRKVEELKKRLNSKDKGLPVLVNRKDQYLGSELKSENQTIPLINPPPSPVDQDQSPEYKTHPINHVLHEEFAEKPCSSASLMPCETESIDKTSNDLISYDDDFLEVHCGDMDLF